MYLCVFVCLRLCVCVCVCLVPCVVLESRMCVCVNCFMFVQVFSSMYLCVCFTCVCVCTSYHLHHVCDCASFYLRRVCLALPVLVVHHVLTTRRTYNIRHVTYSVFYVYRVTSTVSVCGVFWCISSYLSCMYCT